jgi:hypothetical protein
MNSCDAKLPSFFRPGGHVELVRVGRANDGGYLVDPRTIDTADVLVGFGVNDDWSFEEDFTRRKPVPVYAYDPTVNRALFQRRLLKAYMQPWHIKRLAHARRISSGYDHFFKDQHVHIEKFVGMPQDDAALNVIDILDQNVPENSKVFLKIDIEGSEYRILDDLLANAHRISGLVIEFHDIDLHMAKLETFICEFGLTLCHVHGNNYGGLMPDGVPPVIECVFTSEDVSEAWNGSLPHKLDMPCRTGAADYAISFA